jgi:hypothetical protein
LGLPANPLFNSCVCRAMRFDGAGAAALFVRRSMVGAAVDWKFRGKGRGAAEKMTNFGLVNPGAWPYVTLPIHGARAP